MCMCLRALARSCQLKPLQISAKMPLAIGAAGKATTLTKRGGAATLTSQRLSVLRGGKGVQAQAFSVFDFLDWGLEVQSPSKRLLLAVLQSVFSKGKYRCEHVSARFSDSTRHSVHHYES